MVYTNCTRCGHELRSPSMREYCDSCKWTNSIEASMRELPDDQLTMALFAAVDELDRRAYEIDMSPNNLAEVSRKKEGLALDDLDTHQDENLCRLIKRISENMESLIPEDHLILADAVEMLSKVGHYGED